MNNKINKPTEGAQLEHLLCLEICNVQDQLHTISELTSFLWLDYGITAAYNGFATAKNNDGEEYLCEMYFRTDKVIPKEAALDLMNDLVCNDAGICRSCDHKTMWVDVTEEYYEEVVHHYLIDGIQDCHQYTDEEMYEIFGEDAKILMGLDQDHDKIQLTEEVKLHDLTK